MNISPTQRRLAWVCTVLALFVVSSRAVAQCDIATQFAEPVQLILSLDPINGMAQLQAGSVTPGIVTSSCVPTQILFYDDEAKTSPVGGYTSRTYACNDVTSPTNPSKKLWVAVNNGNPASESDAVGLEIIIRDNIFPSIEPLLSVLVNTTDDGNLGDCVFQDAAFLNIDLTAVPNSLGLVLNPGEYTDNCLSGVTVTYAIDYDNFSGYADLPPVFRPNPDAGTQPFPVGVSTVTYYITDASGNQNFFSLDVSVTDNEVPLLSCPPGFSTSTDPGFCYSTVLISPDVSDNCDALDVTWSAPGPPAANPSSGSDGINAQFPVGTTMVTYTATDGNGLTATCTFNIQVVDNQQPTITCPPSATRSANAASCTYTAVGTEFDPTGLTDNCSITLTPTNPQNTKDGTSTLAGEMFPLGVTAVTWTVTDVNGSAKTCAFTVTVQDNTPPAVTYNVNLGPFNVTPGDCSKVVTFNEPSNATPGSFDCNGPVVLTRDSVFVNGDYTPGFLAGAPAFNPAVVGTVTTQFPVGVTEIQYIWRDAANNKSFRYITVTVEENELPVAKCKSTPIYKNLNPNSGTVQLISSDVDNGSTDNCGIDSYELVPEILTCDDVETGPATVFLTVTDNAGNSATCSAQVTVFDVTPPIIVCPANVTVASAANCTGTVPGLLISEAVTLPVLPGQYDDNSRDCGLTQLSYALNGGPFSPPNNNELDLSSEVFSTGPTTVTIQVQDGSTNASTCIFTVNVTDQQGPGFTAGSIANGATFTQNANLGGCLAQVNWTEPQVGTDCSLPATLTKSHAPNSFFFFGQTTVTYAATDAVGNVSTYTFIINVVDTQKPKAVCQNFTAALNGAGSVLVQASQINGGSTDNCFFDYITTTYGPFSCAQLGNNTVQLKIKDGSGNRDSCVATISVVDNAAPVANCAAVLTNIDLNAAGQNLFAASSLNGTTADNCSGSLSYTLSVDGSAFASTFPFTCAHLGARTLVLRATDGGGNTSTCAKVVTIRDVTAPTFTVPANRTVKCYELQGPSTTGDFSNLADACDNNPFISFVDAVITGCGGSKTITRTWTARDVSMNTRTGSQVITVVDDIKPSFTLPAVVNLNTDNATNCLASFVASVSATTLRDSCTSFVDLTVTYTVDYPTPAYGYIDLLTPTTGTTVATVSNSYPVGTTLIRWTATDQCGNSRVFTQSIVVKDTKAPVFSYNRCGQTYTLPNTSGSCTQLYAWVRPFPTDLFDCMATVITEKFSDPSVQSFVDAVNPYVFPFVPIAAQFSAGQTTVTYTATDASGNSSTCAFTVKILDTQAPDVTCPANQVLATTCTTAAIPSYLGNVQVQDNCPTNVTLTQSPASGTALSAVLTNPMAGNTFTVKILAVDRNANNGRDSCSFIITLNDGAAPVPVEQFLPPIIGRCGRDTVEAPLALDACNPNDSIYGTPSAQVGMFLSTDPPSYFLEVGNYVITWAYNDGNGNISTQQQLITLSNDNFLPAAKCKPAFTVELDSTGAAAITTAMIDNTSTDPDGCGTIGLSINQAAFDCSDLGLDTITLTVTDNAGNTATCTTSVTVKDVSLPAALVVPADTLIEACALIPVAPVITTIDVCSGTLQAVLYNTSTQTASGFNRYNYTLSRLWIATDSSGNEVSAEQVITVKDSQAPVFAANTPTVLNVGTSASNADCKAAVKVKISQYVAECAPGVAIVSSPTGFSVTDTIESLPVGTRTFVFTATDSSGNSSTHTLVITVADSTLPTAVCINGISAALQNSGSVTVNVSQFNNNSFDNCTQTDSLSLRIQRLDSPQTPSATLTYSCPDADGVTKHPVKLYVRDRSGNESSCQTYIVIQDNAAPTFTFCPPSKTVDCQVSLDPALNSNGLATATDNCPLNFTLTYSDSVAFGTGPLACELVTRTWLAKDLPGNTATCVQTFTIQDNKPPIFATLPADATISCNDPLVNPPTVTATDNCSAPADIDIVYAEIKTDTAVGACGQYSYKVQRTWTATDECGNTAVHTQKITVSDTQAPLFPGLQDTLIVLSANHPPTTDCTVLVALNVAPSLTDCTPSSALVVSHNSPFATSGADASGTYPVGFTKIIFTATDLCGNVGKDSVVVNVKDNSIPTVICNNNVVVALGSNGTAVLQPEDIDLGSTDNCDIDTMSLSRSTFSCNDIGDNDVVLTVTDRYGNTNSCTVNVEVAIGPNVGFSLVTTATPESYFGFADGSVQAVATGGSGAFVYAWLPNAATTSTIDSLTAGIYIVTVLDTMTNCIQTDTAIVEAGKKIIVNIDDVSGSPNQLVVVPVTVDNFYQLNGFSFGVIVVDTAVGTIVNTNTLNAGLFGFSATLSNGKVSAMWVGAASVTLPNGTLLFNIEVQLKPNAVIGAVTPVKVSTPFQFLQSIGGSPTVTMADTVNGSITVIPNANIVKIGGDIQTWKVPTKPVPNVNVALTGSVTANQITGPDGAYLFTVPSASNTIVTPSKATAGNDKISAADLLLIQNHIFGNVLLSPYQWVAANVNNSGGPNPITLADYLLIQRVVLGTDQHIQGSADWKFIPKSYVFPTPNPLSTPFPTTISHLPATMDFLNDDFVAVRMGDVNGNVVPEFTGSESEDRSGETFRFRLDDRAFRAGEVITVPFRASDFTDQQAYQLTIEFDPTVFALENIGQGALQLTDDHFGTAHLSDGSLTTVWVSREPVTFRDDEILFTLSFRTLQAGRSLREVLHPGSAVTQAEAYDRDGKTMKIDFDFAQAVQNPDEADFALYQNQPNPFHTGTTIGFRLPTSSRTTLRVFNASGRLVKTVVGDFEKGYNELYFRPDELGAAGVYWYELETPLHSDRKKMILLK